MVSLATSHPKKWILTGRLGFRGRGRFSLNGAGSFIASNVCEGRWKTESVRGGGVGTPTINSPGSDWNMCVLSG